MAQQKQQYPSDYKPTGNLAVDMVGACISHYRKRLMLPAYIRLTPKYWKQFAFYVLQHSPECYDKEGIDFDGVMIQKGSMFQGEALVTVMPKPTLTV